MNNHATMRKRWIILAIAIGCLVGVFGQVGSARADVLSPEPCESLFDCPATPPTSYRVDGTLEFDKTIYELGEIIEGSFSIKNNTDDVISALTSGTSYPFIEVRLFDVSGRFLYEWPTDRLAYYPVQTLEISPGHSWRIGFSWDQRSVYVGGALPAG